MHTVGESSDSPIIKLSKCPEADNSPEVSQNESRRATPVLTRDRFDDSASSISRHSVISRSTNNNKKSLKSENGPKMLKMNKKAIQESQKKVQARIKKENRARACDDNNVYNSLQEKPLDTITENHDMAS